jgi:hypothetical protein
MEDLIRFLLQDLTHEQKLRFISVMGWRWDGISKTYRHPDVKTDGPVFIYEAIQLLPIIILRNDRCSISIT